VAEGLHAVSLRRVASSLGVTAPALYAHVVDKRDLLQGIVESEIDDLLRRFSAIQSDDPIDRLRRMAQTYVDYGLQNPDLFRAMFLFRPELTAEARAGEPALATKISDAFFDDVKRASADGRLDQGDPELVALTLWAAAHGVITTLLSGPPLSLDVKERLASSVLDTTLLGLQSAATLSV